jgi:glycosyltransferase involved in cell wall biosynthesis
MGHSFLHSLRLVSMVEATSVTGPLKPLLMFSRISRQPGVASPGLTHFMLTTRRSSADSHPDALSAAAIAAGLSFHTIPERHAGDWRVLRAMAREISGFAPDLIETHDSKSHFLLLLLRLFYPSIRDLPWVAFHHGYTQVSRRVQLYQQLDRISLRFATKVNTVCLPFASHLESIGVARDRLQVLTNTVTERTPPPSSEIDALRGSLMLRSDEILILSVGRLSREKGHMDLLSAAASLSGGLRPQVRILLAGGGPELAALQQQAAGTGINVTFLGHVADPWLLYHAADFFVLSSHTEGSPLVMFEAMAAGLPILATAVGGIPEVLTNEDSALLVSPGDTAALAKGMERLAGNELLRHTLGRTARQVLQRYSPEAYANKLWGVYRAALSD